MGLFLDFQALIPSVQIVASNTSSLRSLPKATAFQNFPTLKGVKSPLLKFFFQKTAPRNFLASILNYIRKQRYRYTTPPKSKSKF